MKKINKNISIDLEKAYDTTSIFISLKASIEKPGILFNKLNAVYFEGKILFSGDAVPTDLKIINKGSEIRGKKFRLYSRYNVIAPTDGDPIFPTLIWKPNLEAGDDTLYDDIETVTSDDNMFEFVLDFNFK